MLRFLHYMDRGGHGLSLIGIFCVLGLLLEMEPITMTGALWITGIGFALQFASGLSGAILEARRAPNETKTLEKPKPQRWQY